MRELQSHRYVDPETRQVSPSHTALKNACWWASEGKHMPVRLQKETVESMVAKAKAEPDSEFAREVREKLAEWLQDPDLVIDADIRTLIHDTLEEWDD